LVGREPVVALVRVRVRARVRVRVRVRVGVRVRVRVTSEIAALLSNHLPSVGLASCATAWGTHTAGVPHGVAPSLTSTPSVVRRTWLGLGLGLGC